MRHAIAMNDYSEIQHGEACLHYAWNGDHGTKLKLIADSIFPGTADYIVSVHDQMQSLIRNNTYRMCVSEHEQSEDLMGRLSMWRAYGGDNGVALVTDSKGVFGLTNDLKAYPGPVAYFSREKFAEQFGTVVSALDIERESLRACGRDFVANRILAAFRFATLSTKNPGFLEEEEWRVIYMPDVERSDKIVKAAEIVGGIAQTVYKLPLRDLSWLERAIIGACP
jgi:hypothetical protein